MNEYHVYLENAQIEYINCIIVLTIKSVFEN